MFVAVYPGGDAKHAFTGASAYPHCARPRRHLDAILSQPGKYPIIDHSRRNMAFGAVGELKRLDFLPGDSAIPSSKRYNENLSV
jgi:hypothetical protein